MTFKTRLFVAVAAVVSLSACASPNAPGNSHDEQAMDGDHSVMVGQKHGENAVTSGHHGEGIKKHGAVEDDHADEMGGHGEGMMKAGGHGHQAWVEPPHQYEEIRYAGWNDKTAAKRGEALFNQQCAACHGQDGTGSGPVAASLEHPPADLTNHLHQAPGEGDGYLFWRISEGGQVEPFKSAKSAMSAFEGTLSEAQRWDVLTYVHQTFHKGFKQESHGPESMSETHEKASHSMKDQH